MNIKINWSAGEIKNLIRRGDWAIHNNGQIGAGEDFVCDCEFNSPEFAKEVSKAICNSVNNTYGNGIDPTKVSEMYMLLVKLKTSMEKYGYADTANEIQQLLIAAKL